MTWEVRQGDALALLRALEGGSVHCVVTSPPFWGLRDYGVVGQYGLESTPEEYVSQMVAVFREVRRVLRDDGTLWLNMGDTYANGGRGGMGDASTLNGGTESHDASMRALLARGEAARRPPEGLKPKDLVGIPWRVAFALQADGWWLRSDVIWSKPNPMPESVTDRPTKAHEYLFLLSKSATYYYDAEVIAEASVDAPGISRGGSLSRFGPTEALIAAEAHRGTKEYGSSGKRNRRSVWTIATQPFPGSHFAVMPEALVEPCILAGTSPQACEKCGAPWERVVEREPVPVRPNFDGKRGTLPKSAGRGGDERDRAGNVATTTTGWRSSCSCENTGSADCLVLDPFAGSGTVGVVALRHGRRFLGLELNAEYVTMARRRIAGPLFAESPA